MIVDRSRYDYVLVWGHGLKHLDGIISGIRAVSGLSIQFVLRHTPSSIKNLVKTVYSYDYAPFRHLKAKTRYLMNTPGDVVFIFIKNTYPEEDYYGQGAFRHLESQVIRRLKNNLRDKFNPYENNKRTEHHVIHASDNEAQTDYILKHLGFDNGISMFQPKILSVEAPFFLEATKSITLRQVSLAQVDCSLLTDEGNTYIAPIAQSPHFLALQGEDSHYQHYVTRHRGISLRADHHLEKHKEFAEKGIYLCAPHQNAYILVKPHGERYVIVDGLHRAAALLYRNESNAIVGILA